MNINPKTSFQKESKFILKVVAGATIITALAGAYYFFLNNVWKPKVKVISVDFANGFATVEMPFGKKVDIYGDSVFLIGGDWGVKFGTINKNGKFSYENLQLLKRGLVKEYLNTSEVDKIKKNIEMEFYKAKLDGVSFSKDKDLSINNIYEKSGSFIKKGELILVKNVEVGTDKNSSISYKKYTLWNGNFIISLSPPASSEEAFVKASFVDIPEHLLTQIKKPKVYISLGLILIGLATYSIIKERQNS